jgi:two-component system response regulator HydG
MRTLLLVENDDVAPGELASQLEALGYAIYQPRTLLEARRQKPTEFSVVVTDLRVAGGLGTDLIPWAQGTPVLVLASDATIRTAVDVMKLGAAEFLPRPFGIDELEHLLQRVARDQHTPRGPVPAPARPGLPVAGMIGSCSAMRLLYERIRKVAPTESTVLVLGESGTGKELVARALHEQSGRAAAPMISLNCAAIPDSLIESELFGHEKGAFTGAGSARRGLVEAATGGTLFLDEIGELPLEAQARLLRVLQEGEIRRLGAVETRKVDVRLIAATHRDLRQLAQTGSFREDLFYRLNVVNLTLPALRDRGDDILELSERLLERACVKLRKIRLRFSDTALAALAAHSWPGNVRELENAVERAVILTDGEEITPDNLAIGGQGAPIEPTPVLVTEATSAPAAQEGTASLEDYFVRFVQENEGRLTETALAEQLGISRKSLWERRQRLGIPRRKSKL